MPSTAKSKTVTNGPANALASLSATQQEVVESFVERNQVFFEGLVNYNKELTNFFAGRVVTDLDLQQRLLQCRSVEDAMALQGDFVESAVNQYSAEAQKLASIGTDVVKEGLDAISRQEKSPARKKAG